MHDAVIDRGLGCLIGLAIGDALGTTLEFTKRDALPPVTELIGGGPFDLKPGEWTDDTSMALCLADSIIAHDRINERDLMNRFLNWYLYGENSVNGRCFDIGRTTRAALESYEATKDPIAGSTDPRAAGNGSIMRLAPVALRWFAQPSAAIENARAQSVTTHAASEAVDSCGILVAMLVDAIANGTKPKPSGSYSSQRLNEILRGSWCTKTREEIRSTGYVADTLEAALWAVHTSSSFSDALMLAANLGDDADTVAAVTGQIAGATWGLSSIPATWLESVAWRDEILERGRELLSRARN